MTPGPNLIRECYRCQKRFAEPTINSGNTFGAVYWTDGKCEARMLPDTAALVKCAHCKKLVWLDDAPVRGEEEPFRLDKQTPVYIPLQELDFWIALRAGAASTREQQLYTRVRLWWVGNDQFRRASSSAAHTPLQRSNMEALFADLLETSEEERLAKAELARELGRMEEAVRLLQGPASAAHNRYAARLSELTQQGRTQVEAF